MARVKATIASGAALSGVVNVDGRRISGIIMPSAWTAAALTFQVSADGVVYNDLYDEAGAEYSITVAASRYIGVDAGALELSAVDFIKVRSGTTGTPVNQGAAREIIFVLT
jgi:hypothetical protein